MSSLFRWNEDTFRPQPHAPGLDHKWRSRQDIEVPEDITVQILITVTMNSRFTTFKPLRQAPRPFLAWSGPWSTSMMLHEFEYFQCELLDRRAVTAPNDKYDTQAISYGSLVITILGIFILSTIIFLGHVLILLFPRPPPCRCCCAIRRSVGFSDQSHRGECRGTKPASKLGLRNKRNRLRLRCDRHSLRQSDPCVVAKNVNVNLLEFPITHFWLSRVYSYLRQLSGLPTKGSNVSYKARSRLSYLRQSSGLPLEQSGSSNRVGKQVR